MTRETKVGLLVSCSFLCLVGVVLFCKLREGGTPPGQEAPAVASEEKLPADPSPTAVKEPAAAADGTHPAADPVASVPGAGRLEPTKQVEPLQPVPSGDGASAIQQTAAVEGKGAPPPPPPSAPFVNYTGDNHAAPKPNTELGGSPTPAAPELPMPGAPAPAPAVPVPPPPAPAAPSAAPVVKPTTPPRSEEPAAAPAPPPLPTPGGPDSSRHGSRSTESTGAEGDDAFVGPPAPPGATKHGKAARGSETPGEEKTLLSDVPPPDGKGGKPGVAGDKQNRTTAPPPPVPTAVPLAGMGPGAPPVLPSPAPVPAPALPSVASVEPTKPPLPAEPTPASAPRPENGANLGKPVPTPGAAPAAEKSQPPAPAPIPAADAAPPAPRVRLGSPATPPANQFAQAPNRSLPPVGAAPAATSPPLAVPPAPAARVESFDEETYRCRPGDTFDSISRARYPSAQYAQALLLYNRDHPVAGDSFQGGVTTLRPGQAIYLPPASILEKRFPNVLREPAPPAPAPGVGIAQRAASGASAPFTARGLSASAAAAYRVGAGGEYLRTVAMRALGDSERWQEILQLNPSVNLAAPLPANTVLRLPPDARVPAENRP